jgi:Glycine radical
VWRKLYTIMSRLTRSLMYLRSVGTARSLATTAAEGGQNGLPDGWKLTKEDGKTVLDLPYMPSAGAFASDTDERPKNLQRILDGYFSKGGQHVNINCVNKATLQDAMDHPEKYPNLTVRVSGYAVNYVKLTREQQLEVLQRTFHDKM